MKCVDGFKLVLSCDKFTLVVIFTHARQTFIHENIFPLPVPHPTCNVGRVYPQFLLSVNVVSGGEREWRQQRILKKESSAFSNFCCTTPVSIQGLLFTIVIYSRDFLNVA